MKEKYRTLGELALIFRGMNGDKEAQEKITLGDVEAYIPADTFEEFLEINKLPVFEQVLSIYKPKDLSWEVLAKKSGVNDRSYCWKILNQPWRYTLKKVLQVARIINIPDNKTESIWNKIKNNRK